MIHDPRDCCDSDSPLGCPRPNTPEDGVGALIWLGIALIVGGALVWSFFL